MTITISEELNAYELQSRLWSGAEDTMQRIIDEGKENTFFAIIADLCNDNNGIIDLTKLNDILRFESEQVFEWCGINDKDEKETELTLSETDCDILLVDEEIINYIRKAIEEAPTPYLLTDCYGIESEIGRDLTDDEVEELIKVGA